jgi:NAD(P) transhydrogenase subunit alpha
MRIGIPAEVFPGETRVAATPETVKKLVFGGRHHVIVQSGAGTKASVRDANYKAAGATLACEAGEIYGNSDVILKVQRPLTAELPLLRSSSFLAGLLSPHEDLGPLAHTGVTAFALELLPRITPPWRFVLHQSPLFSV